MSDTSRGVYSAAAAALGYFYQVRYALVESLRRLRRAQSFVVSIETIDDVVFETTGEAPEILQTKHHLNRAASLADTSPDLWKTLRIWCDAVKESRLPDDATFFLITTSQAVEGQAAYYLRIGDSRNCEAAKQRLSSTAATSTNRENATSHQMYRSLDDHQKMALLERIVVIDGAPQISNLTEELLELAYGYAHKRFLDSFLQRLEGWWYRRAIQHLLDHDTKPILSEELEAEADSLREQFKQDNLPIDDDLMTASVDASGYRDRIFVEQLRLIEVGNSRIFHAIRNYYRAFIQRSRWVREDLLLVGELERYESKLMEEWEIQFLHMQEELGDEATGEAMVAAGKALYRWIETSTHPHIRPGVVELSISRGTYQLLSDSQRVGWHLEFARKLQQLNAGRRTAS